MKRARWWIIGMLVVAVVFLIFLWRLIGWQEAIGPASERAARWNLYLELFKLILVGFVVTMLGILIPGAYSESKDAFERRKESRIAFSRAKTGVDYLAVRLCGLSLKEATTLLQNTHVWKHRAELYDELAEHLEKRRDGITPREWGNDMYEHLHEARRAIEANAAEWDVMDPDERLEILKESQRLADETTALERRRP